MLSKMLSLFDKCAVAYYADNKKKCEMNEKYSIKISGTYPVA